MTAPEFKSDVDSVNSSVEVGEIIQALYLTLLNREISAGELNRLVDFYRKKKFIVSDFAKNIIGSQEFAINVDRFMSTNSYLKSRSIGARLEGERNVAIIAVFDEIWFPFCLAIADYLHEEFGLKSIFITYVQFSASMRLIPFCESSLGVIWFEQINEISSKFEPALLVTHSFGWVDKTEFLINKFSYTPLMVYGDGYKNSVSEMFDILRPVCKSLMFGFDDDSFPMSERVVIESKKVNEYRKKIAETYDFSAFCSSKEPKNYSVFYMRYWGRGAYTSLEHAKIVQIWLSTVLRFLNPNDILIVKNDPRVDEVLYAETLSAFIEAGVNVLKFEDYITTVGGDSKMVNLLPVEYFYTNGLLCSANSHFVLDSALSYSLAIQDNIVRPCKIYIGADDFHFDQDINKIAIENIKYGLQVYGNGLVDSKEVGEVIELEKHGTLLRCFELR
jgi:hypothetical protein